MDFDPLKLENQLCFPLYVGSKEVIKKYKPHLDELGITYTQYISMMALWEHEALSVKELGQHLYLDSGTLTPLLKKMEAQGLITRTRSTEDERSVLITLTEKGRSMRKKARSIPERVGSCIPLSPEESQQLYTLLYKVINEIQPVTDQ